MTKRVENTITIENAKIVFRNFSGAEGKFNPAGRRNFSVLLDDDIAEVLVKDGWNVKYLDPKEEEEKPQAYLQVRVKYNRRPPKIFLVTETKKTRLNEDMVSILDWADITNVDLIIRPYNWEVRGNTGVTAYVQSLYATIYEDELDKKYRDVPDSAQNTLPDDEDDEY